MQEGVILFPDVQLGITTVARTWTDGALIHRKNNLKKGHFLDNNLITVMWNWLSNVHMADIFTVHIARSNLWCPKKKTPTFLTLRCRSVYSFWVKLFLLVPLYPRELKDLWPIFERSQPSCSASFLKILLTDVKYIFWIKLAKSDVQW